MQLQEKGLIWVNNPRWHQRHGMAAEGSGSHLLAHRKQSRNFEGYTPPPRKHTTSRDFHQGEASAQVPEPGRDISHSNCQIVGLNSQNTEIYICVHTETYVRIGAHTNKCKLELHSLKILNARKSKPSWVPMWHQKWKVYIWLGVKGFNQNKHNKSII